tara:strand:+ start:258 stop:1637 length:1380 start_codon:yes stop_codon:yes gene_type:complete
MLDKFTKKEAPIQGIAGLGGGVVRVASSGGGESYWITYTRRSSSYELYSKSIVIDSSGSSYILNEDSQSFGVIYSLDNKGVIQWAYRVRDPNVGGSSFFHIGIDPDSGGNLITSAYMRSHDHVIGFDPSDGSFEFRESSGTASTGFSNDSPIATNSTHTYILGRAGGGEYAYLYKFSNSDGSNTWTYRMYSGQYNVDNNPWGVFLDTQSTGTFIMYKMSSGSYEGVHVTKVDVNGGLVNWLGGSNNTVKFNGGRYFYPYGGTVDSSGNMYVVGGYLGSGWAPRLIKLSTSGSILWQRYASTSTGYILGGVVTDSEDNVYAYNQSGSRCLIWKWNSSGTLQWERGFRTSNSSTFSAEQIKCDGNDNLYLIGYAVVTPSSRYHSIVAKFKSDGSITGTYSPFVWESDPVNQSWDTSSLMSVSAENYSSQWAANTQYSWSENTDVQQDDFNNSNLVDATVNT